MNQKENNMETTLIGKPKITFDNVLWLGEVPPCRMLKFSTKACGGLPNHCYKPFFFGLA
jgi:hypothetical protein